MPFRVSDWALKCFLLTFFIALFCFLSLQTPQGLWMEIHTLHSHNFSLRDWHWVQHEKQINPQYYRKTITRGQRSQKCERKGILCATIIMGFIGIINKKKKHTHTSSRSNKSYKPIINYSQIDVYPVLLEHTHSTHTLTQSLHYVSVPSVWLILPGLMRNITLPHVLVSSEGWMESRLKNVWETEPRAAPTLLFSGE